MTIRRELLRVLSKTAQIWKTAHRQLRMFRSSLTTARTSRAEPRPPFRKTTLATATRNLAQRGVMFEALETRTLLSADFLDIPVLEGTAGHDSLDVRGAITGYEIRGLEGRDSIYGSAHGDLIIGGLGADQMFGNAGDDTFLMESADTAADLVYGGEGLDTILGTPSDDVILLNVISSIERIDGAGGHDILRGHDAPNYWNFSLTELIGIYVIDGAGGNDQIVASPGNDRIIGGPGNDILDGGAGTDTAVYSGNFSLYTLTALSGGQLRVANTANADGTDTIKGFEVIEFADGTYANGVFTPLGDPTNSTPSATADAYTGTEDTDLVVPAATGVLSNDQDADSDTLSVTAYDTRSVQQGTITMNPDGSFTYTSAPNFNGQDSFSYTISDGRGGQASAQVNLSITPTDDAPIVRNDQYTTSVDSVLSVAATTGVLANDQDIDGDTLTVSAFDSLSAQGGAVSMNTNGAFTYTPPSAFTGTDTFNYTASDGHSQISATVAINVSDGQSTTPMFDQIIANIPEGGWALLNTNTFQSIWTPQDQRPYESIAGSPAAIVYAWGAATWDPHRLEYIIWGGGHANYEGNEIYTWSATTLEWERASLPSAVVDGPFTLETIDGYLYSPISSHAYDNLEFLEIANRMINFGGAAAHSGGGFVETDGTTRTGPYFWNPALANANQVGGSTGSQVDPEQHPNVIGGEMWENREAWLAGSMVSGTTDYAQIDGMDVVFVNDTNRLYKYTVPDVDDASLDTWEIVGTVWDTYSGPGAGAFDSSRNIYVRTSTTEFTFWDLNSPGATNRNMSFVPADASGDFALSQFWGMEYDPVRERFVLWEGGGDVWHLEPPETLGSAGWVLTKETATSVQAPPKLLYADGFRGVLGKWDYVASHDVFVGVIEPVTGNIWIYKPEGWTPVA
jgi:VCBS repeat-containing protein